jgi:hypothetical protein
MVMDLFFAIYLCHTSIFVVHKDMDMDEDAPPWDPHEYWKMKVVSFHKDVSSGERWVLGTWFYSPSDLEPHINPEER